MKLNSNLKQVLEGISFLDRYKRLSNSFPFHKESLESYSNDKILSITEAFGYNVKFNKRENFFGINETIDDFKFTFNISFKYGVVEFIWDVLKEKERLTLGGPWGLIGDLLVGDKCNIKKPAFRNYEELIEILKEAFLIYEDFKKEVIAKLD